MVTDDPRMFLRIQGQVKSFVGVQMMASVRTARVVSKLIVWNTRWATWQDSSDGSYEKRGRGLTENSSRGSESQKSPPMVRLTNRNGEQEYDGRGVLR